jgi:uncharacterized protein related to proFAR isomerase
MQLIPVIDLMRGAVVRAVRGDRSAYRPIDSPLCASSEPLTVARTLCEHCASDTLYVADLDALLGGPVQHALLGALLAAMPRLVLWLDAGFAGADAAAALRSRWDAATAARVVPVFGSESIATREAMRRCFAVPAVGASHTPLLSLDRRNGERLDPAGCWEAPELWPERVIVMTLERVGANAGPDLDTLTAVQRAKPGATLIGAGGIRDAGDLRRAADAGAGAWLVASALHDGRLPAVTR